MFAIPKKKKKVMNKGSLIVESLLLEIKYFLSPKIISFVRNVIFLIKIFKGKSHTVLSIVK